MDVIKNLPVFYLDIDDMCQEDGVTIMSIVDCPAVEKDFLKFSKVTQKYSLNEEKKIITGVAIRADYPIYRNDGKGEYYIKFNADSIEKMVCKFMRELRNNDVNINHSDTAEGIYLIESFILNDKHHISYPEFRDVENGSWMVSYKVDNQEVWKEIKEKKLNGFSIEVNGNLKKQDKLSEIYDLIKTING